jgi:hypothetical protein
MTTRLQLGGSKVTLPVVPFAERPVPAFLPPEHTPVYEGYESLDLGTTSGFGEISSVERNPQTGVVTVTATNAGGTRYPWGVDRYRESIVHQTSESQPELTSVRGAHSLEVVLDPSSPGGPSGAPGGRTLRWEGDLLFRSDAESFYYAYTRRIIENGQLLREKTWKETIPRDHQ